MTKHCILVSLIALLQGGDVVSGFATPSNRQNPLNAPRGASESRESITEAHIVDDSATFDLEEVGRRQFLSSIVGAASILALSETASAVDSSSAYTANNSMSLASSETSGAGAPKPSVDTRAILDKATKKALGGE